MTTTYSRPQQTLVILSLVIAGICIFPITAPSHGISQENEKPVFSAYKGVTIGMTRAEARNMVGTARDRSDSQDLYVFSENESAQIYYDAASGTVSAITVTYSGKLDKVPGPKAVFGSDVEAKPDGGIFKMVRYPTAGYWISYNKIAGDDPIVIIAMKKI